MILDVMSAGTGLASRQPFKIEIRSAVPNAAARPASFLPVFFIPVKVNRVAVLREAAAAVAAAVAVAVVTNQKKFRPGTVGKLTDPGFAPGLLV